MAKESKMLRNSINSALRFWEPMRLIYNLMLLAGIFTFCFGYSWCMIKVRFFELVFCAVVANFLYSQAYFPDLLLGMSDYRKVLKYVRPLLFLLGLLFSLFVELTILSFF